MLASTDAPLCERCAWCWRACRPLSLLDLTCSLCHIPPRRACRPSQSPTGPSAYLPSCGSACATVISSIDDATLSLMRTGFTVTPRPRRAGGLVYALQARVHESKLGRAAEPAKGCGGDLTQLGPPGAGLRLSAQGKSTSGFQRLRGHAMGSDAPRSRHRMRFPRGHRDADDPGPRHLRRCYATIDGFRLWVRKRV